MLQAKAAFATVKVEIEASLVSFGPMQLQATMSPIEVGLGRRRRRGMMISKKKMKARRKRIIIRRRERRTRGERGGRKK